MGLKAGRLRHRLEFQERVQIQDPDTGGAQFIWQAVAGMESVPGDLEHVSARDFIAADANQSEVRARATIRYREGVMRTMRIVHRGAAYDIVGILTDNESGLQWLTMPLTEGVRVD